MPDIIETIKAPEKSLNRQERFINSTIERCKNDTGLTARLKRGDNPATEYQCWDFLAGFGINLEKEYERLPYVAVVAALAREKPLTDGTLGLGETIAACFPDGKDDNQAQMRLRRILACNDMPELCRVLRPVLSLIQSRAAGLLCYSRLLTQLQRFHFNDQQIKAQWAQSFYSSRSSAPKEAK